VAPQRFMQLTTMSAWVFVQLAPLVPFGFIADVEQ
jgi:hypothetical protein